MASRRKSTSKTGKARPLSAAERRERLRELIENTPIDPTLTIEDVVAEIRRREAEAR